MILVVSWVAHDQDPNLKEWRVYASTSPASKGELVATAAPDARQAEVELSESEWTIRVLAVRWGDAEEPWEGEATTTKTTYTVPGRGEAPTAPAEATVLPVDLGAPAVVQVEPGPADEEPTVVQVIEGPDEHTGKLVGEVRVPPGGPAREGAALPSVPIPLGGSGRSSTRSLLLASRSEGGARGAAATAVNVVVPERAGMEGTLIASVDVSGGTHVGFGVADASRGVAFTTVKGFCTTRLPTGLDSAGWASLGAANAGWRFTSTPFGPFPSRMVVTSDEHDIGSTQTFFLECFDQARRVGDSVLLSLPGHALSLYRGAPGNVERLRQEDTDGPAWALRSYTGEGKHRRPLIGVRWEYVVGTSSTPSPSESDWKPLPQGGAYLSGRYVRTRLVVRDPIGWHSLMSGNLEVYVRIQRVDRRGAGSPEGVVQAPPGSRYLDTTSGAYYVKQTGFSSTGWVSVSGGPPSGASGGDLTGTYPSPTVAPNAITNAKAADMANGTIKGRSTAGSGDPEDLTGAQATALLSAVVGDSGAGGTKGLVPAPGAGDAAAGKFLKASGAWAVPTSTLDINGLTAETAPAIADTVPVYDDSAGANRKVALGELRALMAEHVAQVRLVYTGATDLGLVPHGGSLIEVNGEIVDVGSGLYLLNTDNLISSTGADAGSAPAATTLYYAYVSNSQASFAPGDLRLSATAPTGIHGGLGLGTNPKGDDFYLGTSGNARHWRFVGLVRTVGSSQFAFSDTQRLVASYYNRQPWQLLAVPAYADGNSATSYTTTSTTWARANAGTGNKVEWLSFGDECFSLLARSLCGNSGSGNATRIGVGYDSTTSARVEAAHNSGTAAISIAADYVYTPTVGYHYCELLICVSAGTGTYYADDARAGSAADPYLTYLMGVVMC